MLFIARHSFKVVIVAFSLHIFTKITEETFISFFYLLSFISILCTDIYFNKSITGLFSIHDLPLFMSYWLFIIGFILQSSFFRDSMNKKKRTTEILFCITFIMLCILNRPVSSDEVYSLLIRDKAIFSNIRANVGYSMFLTVIGLQRIYKQDGIKYGFIINLLLSTLIFLIIRDIY